MQQFHKSILSSISGGNTEYRSVPSTVLAAITQVSTRVRATTPSSDEYGETTPHCNQYSHKAATPKNGDRNAQGQQYSWGTWWDDMA